jgi:cytochrome c peroxidase
MNMKRLIPPITGSAVTTLALAASSLLACDGRATPAVEEVATLTAALTAEDGLAEAFAQFKHDFVDNNGFDRSYRIGFGFHPGLSTEKLVADGHPPRGQANFDFTGKRITAVVINVPATVQLDLWLVKNIAGSGKSIKPESGDTLLKLGAFGGTGSTRTLDVAASASQLAFDLDLIVVTRRNQSPTASRVALGARGVLEKRFFRERAGKKLDPVTGTLAKDVETTDALVARGSFLFFNETFGGNGRTCGTCHRAERSLTIDPAFIATLPQSDPLFIAENNSTLRQLEDPVLLRTRGLIRENLDGFDDPTHVFVARGVPHTLGLTITNGMENAFSGLAPDQRVGWGGDGAPGRSVLNEFAVGAIIQHFTRDLRRRPGVDFRLPTQEEVDALEAFQLFTGRQAVTTAFSDDLGLREPAAQRGQEVFFGGAANCTFCHSDLSGVTSNSNFNTNTAALLADLPPDDGFLDSNLTGDSGTFSPPGLLEAADTGPFFHANARPTIEAAVEFYVSPEFQAAPDTIGVFMTPGDIQDVAAFLRTINACENIRQVRKRVQFVRNNRSSGNTSLLTAAIADTQDAITDLQQRGLSPAAVNELEDIKSTLETARANADAARPPFMDHALTFLGLARGELIAFNPKNQF